MKIYKTLLYLFLSMSITQIARPFNFTQELRNVQKITDTFELIASYQKIAKQVRTTDSTRLSKKFIRTIKNLDHVCQNHEEEKIKKAYLSLLNTSLTNEKLRGCDRANELSELTKIYKPKISTPKETKEITQAQPKTEDTPQEISHTERVAELTPTALKAHIEQALQDGSVNRNEIVRLLTLKKLTRQVDSLTRNVNKIEPSIKQLFRKLQLIEELLKSETFEEHITKSLGLDYFTEENLEAESASFFDGDKRAE